MTKRDFDFKPHSDSGIPVKDKYFKGGEIWISQTTSISHAHLLGRYYVTKRIKILILGSTCSSQNETRLEYLNKGKDKIVPARRFQPKQSTDWAHQFWPILYIHLSFIIQQNLDELNIEAPYHLTFVVNCSNLGDLLMPWSMVPLAVYTLLF